MVSMSICPEKLLVWSICFSTFGIVCAATVAVFGVFWMLYSVVCTVIFITVRTRLDLASCYVYLDLLAEGLTQESRARVAHYCSAFGRDGDDTTAIQLGQCLDKLARPILSHEEVSEYLSKACAFATATLDFGALWTVDHSALLSAFFKLANTFCLLEDYERAADVYKQVQVLSKQTSRADHDFDCAYNLGFCASKLKRHQEAAEGFELAMQLARSNEEKGDCCAHKAAALLQLGQFLDALSLIHQGDLYGYSSTLKQASARNVELSSRTQGMQKELAKSTAEALRTTSESAESLTEEREKLVASKADALLRKIENEKAAKASKVKKKKSTRKPRGGAVLLGVALLTEIADEKAAAAAQGGAVGALEHECVVCLNAQVCLQMPWHAAAGVLRCSYVCHLKTS
jgi:tetratricopeptide (TPR) repeat protein